MKKLSILLTGMMLAAGTATAQTNNEGSILPSYETQTSQPKENGGHRGLDFSIRPGFQFSTGDNSSTSFTADLELGKRFSNHFYWGVGTGVIVPSSEGSIMIPVTTDAKVFFPLKTKTFTPGILLRSGYVINTDDGYDIPTGRNSYDHIDAPNFVMLQAMPTLDIALNSRTDFSIGVGYTHYMATTSDGKGFGAFTIQGAFNFHKRTDGKRKPKVPTRDRGVELTFEGGIGVMKSASHNAHPNPGGNFIASYKFNPNLNVGVGFGYSKTTNDAWTDGDGIYTSYTPYDGYKDHTFESSVGLGTISTTRLFLRGEYALSTKKFAPFVSCDLGLNMYSYSCTADDQYFGGYNGNGTRDYRENSDGEEIGKALYDKVKKSGLFVSPAIGASLRLTNNSYLKFRIGYQLTSGGCKHELSENELKGHYKKAEIKCIQYSQPYINIGFTHTFSWGENWFK